MAYDASAAEAFSGRPNYDLFMYVRRDATDTPNRRATYAFQVIARWRSGSPRSYDLTGRTVYMSVGSHYQESYGNVLDFRSQDNIIVGSGVTGWITHDSNGYLNLPFAAEMVSAGLFGSASPSGTLSADRIWVVPSTPPNPVYVSRTPTALTFNISAPSDNGGTGVTNYQMQVLTTGGSQVALWSSTASSQTVPGNVLSPNTAYDVRYQALNAVGYSGWTSLIRMTTAVGVPSAPLNPVALDVAPTTLVLDWDVPAATNGGAITGYVIQRALNATFNLSPVTYSPAGTATLFNASGLDPSARYFWRIAAVNSAGQGPWSATVDVTTVSGLYVSNGTTYQGAGVFASVDNAWVACEVFISDGTDWIAAI